MCVDVTAPICITVSGQDKVVLAWAGVVCTFIDDKEPACLLKVVQEVFDCHPVGFIISPYRLLLSLHT
jgi:hypothetical protein